MAVPKSACNETMNDSIEARHDGHRRKGRGGQKGKGNPDWQTDRQTDRQTDSQTGKYNIHTITHHLDDPGVGDEEVAALEVAMDQRRLALVQEPHALSTVHQKLPGQSKRGKL